jgi:NAD(P)-dependent dehydrogenase (short-subunit alcohol dehydrogenase family)
MSDVVVVVGAGSIGQAIARRVSAGKKVLSADLRQDNADARRQDAERPRLRRERCDG